MRTKGGDGSNKKSLGRQRFPSVFLVSIIGFSRLWVFPGSGSHNHTPDCLSNQLRLLGTPNSPPAHALESYCGPAGSRAFDVVHFLVNRSKPTSVSTFFGDGWLPPYQNSLLQKDLKGLRRVFTGGIGVLMQQNEKKQTDRRHSRRVSQKHLTVQKQALGTTRIEPPPIKNPLTSPFLPPSTNKTKPTNSSTASKPTNLKPLHPKH